MSPTPHEPLAAVVSEATAGVPAGVVGTGGPTAGLVSSPWFRALFQAELWERFSFYGVQAVLVLYAVAPRDEGGLGLSDGSGAAVFGAYIGVTFMMALPGGWLADRVLGQQRALVIGLGLLSLGSFTIAAARPLTALGLVLIACGFGLFKPAHQTLINVLAGSAGRREATVAAFYIGIQVTGLIAPLVIGSLGERVSWRLAFAVTGAVLAFGTLLTSATRKSLGTTGTTPARPFDEAESLLWKKRLTRAVIPLGVVLFVLGVAGLLPVRAALAVVGLGLIAAPWGAYRRLRRSPGLTETDRGRISVMLALMSAAALFWLLAGQDASVLTLFAKDSTDRDLGGFEVPASWLQAGTPFFMLILAPVVAWQLPRLGARYSVPVKYVFGLVLVGVSFLVMAVAAERASGGDRVSPFWLLAVFLLHAVAEIVIAAVSISCIADLVPAGFLGQAIGVYWLFAALGGGLSSQLAALIDVIPDSTYYLLLAGLAFVVTAFFLAYRARLAAPFGPTRPPVEPTPSDPRESVATLGAAELRKGTR